MKTAHLFAALVALSSLPAAAALPGPESVAFAKGAKFAVAKYSGSETLTNFPVLVRISDNAPAGFTYADVRSASAADRNAIDLAFVDMEGEGLPFEIDTWDPTGESLVWVRLPTMTNGAEFVMCWGSASPGKAVCAESPFSGYVGVWHMSEASGPVADSSGNGFAATPSGTAAATNCVAVSGPVGNGRQCSTALGAANLSYLSVPSYDSKSVGDTFAVSGWVSIGSGQTGNDNDARLFSRKENYQNTHGWEVLWKTGKEIRVRGAASADNIKVQSLDYAGKGWKHVFIVYDGRNSVFYENGAQKGSKTNGTAATENGRPLAIGGYANDNGSQLLGSVDECRLLDDVPSADWAKAEYDTVADAAFLTAGEAESYEELVDLAAGVSVTSVAYTNATILSSILCLGTGATSADVLVQLAATSDFAAPLRSANYSVDAAGVTNVPVAGLATNATYWVRAFVTNSLGAAVAAGPVSFTTLAPGAPAGTAAIASAGFTTLSATCTPSSLGTGAQSATIWLEASTNGVVAASASAPAAAGAAATLSLSGLDPATTYRLRVRIVNDWGLETVLPLGEAATRDVPIDGDGPTWVFAANGRTVDFSFDVTEVFDGVACTATLLYDNRTIGPTTFTTAGTLSWAGVQAASAPVPASVLVEAVVDGGTYSQTWTAPRPVAPGGLELYVDSLAAAGGTGYRIDSPVRTIPEALALAEANATIWVRGGTGRSYGVTNDVDTIPIPATLEGLSIRAYAATPGDGGLASVAISDTYVAGGGRAHIVSNAAANVTIEGLDFAFGPSSLGVQNIGACALVWIGAPFATVENCRFRMSAITGYAGTGANDGKAIVECASGRPATNLVVRRCEFYNTRTRKRGHAFSPPVRCANGGAIVQNVFSNVNWTASTRGDSMSFVSNVVFGANAETGQTGSLLLATGKTAEIAYNVFVEDPVGINDDGNRHRDHVAFFAFWRDGTGTPYRIHHNTCIGGSVLVLGIAETRSTTCRKPEMFCNLFVPRAVGTNILENAESATMTNIWNNVPTSFRPGSTFRNNACPDTTVFNGGTASSQVTNYRLVGEDGLFVTNNVVLAEPPVFVCTDDVYSADYYRYRTSRTAAVDLGVLGWRGENNEYPLWIGAKPPLYPSATMLILK